MKTLKVYGGTFMKDGEQFRGIMAGTQADIANAFGISLSYFRNYWAQTGNVTELGIALSHPNVPFWTRMTFTNGYRCLNRKDEPTL